MATLRPVEYRYGNELDLEQVTELYRASTLGERRPIDDPETLRSMIAHANLVVTAWDGELLVGIARTLTDFAYVGYLSDLAVRDSHQRQGMVADGGVAVAVDRAARRLALDQVPARGIGAGAVGAANDGD